MPVIYIHLGENSNLQKESPEIPLLFHYTTNTTPSTAEHERDAEVVKWPGTVEYNIKGWMDGCVGYVKGSGCGTFTNNTDELFVTNRGTEIEIKEESY